MRLAEGEGVWPWRYSYPSSHRLMRALGSCLREFLPGIFFKLLMVEEQRWVPTDTAAAQLKRKGERRKATEAWSVLVSGAGTRE